MTLDTVSVRELMTLQFPCSRGSFIVNKENLAYLAGKLKDWQSVPYCRGMPNVKLGEVAKDFCFLVEFAQSFYFRLCNSFCFTSSPIILFHSGLIIASFLLFSYCTELIFLFPFKLRLVSPVQKLSCKGSVNCKSPENLVELMFSWNKTSKIPCHRKNKSIWAEGSPWRV